MTGPPRRKYGMTREEMREEFAQGIHDGAYSAIWEWLEAEIEGEGQATVAEHWPMQIRDGVEHAVTGWLRRHDLTMPADLVRAAIVEGARAEIEEWIDEQSQLLFRTIVERVVELVARSRMPVLAEPPELT